MVFKVWGLEGFGVQGLGLRSQWSIGFRVWGHAFLRVASGYRVEIGS